MARDVVPDDQTPQELDHVSLLDNGGTNHSNNAIQNTLTAQPEMPDTLTPDISPLILPAPVCERTEENFVDQSDSSQPRQNLVPLIPFPVVDLQARDANMSSDFNINVPPPFLNPVENLGLQAYGVLKLTNIPYSVTISEIKHLIKGMSEHALVEDHQQGFAVHIVMERSTGKTMECFVELQYPGAAEDLVSKAETRYSRGKAVKIGSRHINFSVSSEGELAAALFPRAKNCFWSSIAGVPEIHQNSDPYSEGFQGFFTIEEVTNIVKLADVPQRSQFSNRSHQRPYESMISILYKFPWSSIRHYTVNARNLLFTAYMHLLRLLVEKVPPMTDPANFYHIRPQAERQVGINHALLMDFLFAGLNTPCFSLRQKCFIVSNCGPIGLGFPLEFHAAEWPFQALSPPPRFPDNLLATWLRIFKIGYHVMKSTNDSHGFERFVNLAYDDSGCPIFDLTDLGRSLLFGELIDIETRLMEKIVDKGRAKWCFDNCVPYAPTNSHQPFPHVYPVDPLRQAVQAFGFGEVGGTEGYRSRDPAREHNQQSMTPLPPPRPLQHTHTVAEQILSSSYHHEIDKGRHAELGVYSAAFPGSQQLSQLEGRKIGIKAPVTRSFNPATPPFIPSQPWSATSQAPLPQSQAPANAPKAPRSHSVGNTSLLNAQTARSTENYSGDSIKPSQPTISTGERPDTNINSSSESASFVSPGRFLDMSRQQLSSDSYNGMRWSSRPWTSRDSRSMPNDPANTSSLVMNEIGNPGTASRPRSSGTNRYNASFMNSTIKEESGTELNMPRGDTTDRAKLAE